MNAKKALIIVSVLLVLSLGSLLVYNYFFRPTSPGAETGSGGALPSASPGQNAGTGSAGSPPRGNTGQTVKYYARANGHIWESDFLGANLKKISAATLNGLIKAVWSPDAGKVIGIFSDNDKIKKYRSEEHT